MLSNPPYGKEWKKDQKEIEKESDLGFQGRFGAGLPRISDGQLLFLQTMLAKMKPSNGGSRIAIVMNGSPLFTGDAGSGESEIRRWIIENDWLGDIPAGWESWKVAHLFNKIGSGTTPPPDDIGYYEGDIPWVITGELEDNEIFDSENKVTKKAVQELSALKIFPKDSLLIAMYGATIGKMAILRIPATTNQACCILGDSKLIDTNFSFYYFLAFRPHLIALSYGGGQPNISQDTIRSIKIFLPVISEQKKIAAFLDRETAKIDEMAVKKQKMIELLKEKRQALITHAVTGKIKV